MGLRTMDIRRRTWGTRAAIRATWPIPDPATTGAAAPYYQGGHPGGWYWHGGYWPQCAYYPGWSWYLPVLPVGYATYWWGGMPYYYWNSLYYTWSSGDNGYVVTDPPPVAGSDEGSADAGGAYEQAPEGTLWWQRGWQRG